jgi:mannose-1-phosphate guanylyltransferase
MAGGAGLRLWPLSRQSKPKQFICVDGDECMLVQTIRRICEAVAPDRCYVITNENLLDITRNTLEGLIPLSNIITEPMRKNTAACIAYATMEIREKCGPGVLCFVPADGYVKDSVRYREAVLQAFETAERTMELVVIGIVPAYPATGYGYMHVDKDPEIKVSKVYRFTEKPNATTAKNMVDSGEYLWNGGILIGLADAIIKNIEAYLPGHFNALTAAVMRMDDSDYPKRIREAYSRLDDISFDYGVLEKANGVYAVKGYFDWDDIGSLDALSKTLKPDEDGNAACGMHFILDTHNSVIYSEDMFIATIGIDHMIVVATKDALIVCPRERAQEIKPLVEKLGLNGLDKFV